jgi:hypothetical protein
MCHNGGFCRNGVKDLGVLHDKFSDVSHLNQTYDNEHFAHCVCPEGFVGLTCEHQLEICGENEHVCLHGSACIIDESGRHSCDCSKADELVGGNDKPIFAGDSCQYTGTDICIIGEEYPGRPLYFCVNGGSCSDKVSANEPDPGCVCPPGYVGDHCEELSQSVSTGFRSSDAGFIGGIAAAALFASLLFISTGVFIARRRGKSTSSVNTSSTSGNPFPKRRRRRAGYVGTSNLQPPSRNQSSLADDISSSSDPIVTGLALAPDDEPDGDGIMNDNYHDQQPYLDDPVLVAAGPTVDDDGNQLDNVDFV